MNLTADIPQFKYKQYNFDNVSLSAKGNSRQPDTERTSFQYPDQ